MAEHEQWFDELTGEPINAGYIYIGAVNLDPQANPITIYSDRDLSVPITNPQRTGTDGRSENKIWVPGQYSIEVEDSANVQKYISMDNGRSMDDSILVGSSLEKTTGTPDTVTLNLSSDAEWINLGDTPTYATTTTFTITGDVTSEYDVGRRIKCTDASTLYGEITASSYSDPSTTVTVSLDSGSLSASLTAVSVGILSGQNQSIPSIKDNIKIDDGRIDTTNVHETIVNRSNPADTTVSTTETSEDEISITIPSSWNTYDVEVVGTCGVDETGTGTINTNINIRIREGAGTGGAEIGLMKERIGFTTPDNRVVVPIFGYAEGETATGSITWALTSAASADSGLYSMIDIRWQVRVYRVT